MADNGQTQPDNVQIAAPPPDPEPYPAPGYPKVLFSKVERQPPRIVNNDAELGALNPLEWTQIPPVQPKAGEGPQFPALFINVNVPPKLVRSEAEAVTLGTAWTYFDLQPIIALLPPATETA